MLRRQYVNFSFIIALMASSSCSANSPDLEDGLYADFKTSKGSIIVKLFPDKAPLTVVNFAGLAEGNLTFANKQGQFFNGLIFHRVIENFMIQGGDPEGNGTGGPGYNFIDETGNGLIFDEPGILAMANSGPNTNGSQFFITHVPTPWLNGNHTIFGKVAMGQDVVDSILQGDTIESVSILRIGKEAKKFKSNDDLFEKVQTKSIRTQERANQRTRKKLSEEISRNWPEAVMDEKTGVYSLIVQEGTGAPSKSGDLARVHYTARVLNGNKFDSSRERGQPVDIKLGTGQVAPGWDLAMLGMRSGEQKTVIIPPEMGFGDKVYGSVPANSWLLIELELISFEAE